MNHPHDAESVQEHRGDGPLSDTPLPKTTGMDPTRKPLNTSIATLASEISSYLFKYLAGFRIPTFIPEKGSDQPTKLTAQIPLQVRIHNVAMGDFSRLFGIKEGSELAVPVIEHYYKNPDLGNPLVNEFHMYSMGLATPEQLRSINRLASKTNVVLKSFFERREMKLLVANLEFGVSGTQVVVCDEISPRTCRLGDISKKDRGGKDIFAPGYEDSLEAYTEVRNRIYRTF
jgi:phosphoribosylaminoimidazole-succinocarboxamide synthase